MTVWSIILHRRDPETWDALQHQAVMSFDEATSPHTLGGTMLALAFTTTVITVPNGEAFDFVMHRDDPYTEAPIGDTVILEGFTENPEARWPTAESMRGALRDNIAYFPEAVE